MTTIGILGAGQLGRMIALSGYPLGMRFRFLDPASESPANLLADHLTADYAAYLHWIVLSLTWMWSRMSLRMYPSKWPAIWKNQFPYIRLRWLWRRRKIDLWRSHFFGSWGFRLPSSCKRILTDLRIKTDWISGCVEDSADGIRWEGKVVVRSEADLENGLGNGQTDEANGFWKSLFPLTVNSRSLL